jgi:hypothetical protein
MRAGTSETDTLRGNYILLLHLERGFLLGITFLGQNESGFFHSSLKFFSLLAFHLKIWTLGASMLQAGGSWLEFCSLSCYSSISFNIMGEEKSKKL